MAWQYRSPAQVEFGRKPTLTEDAELVRLMREAGDHEIVELVAVDAAQPRAYGVPDGWKLVASDALPPCYTLGSDKNDGSFWPLFDSQYISNSWYATKAEAETAAWRHAHERLNGYMDSVRRYAMLAAAPAPAKAGEA